MTSSPFLVTPRPNPTARSRLVVFPYAGGGAAVFYHWLDRLPLDIELSIVRLPGRESLVDTAPFRDSQRAASHIADTLVSSDRRPVACFGHSLGALMAYETVRELRRRGGQLPYLLMLSGRSAAHVPMRREPVFNLPRTAFFAQLVAMGGMPEEMLALPELLEFVEPTLRADLAINDTYQHVIEPPLAVPFVTFAGRQDGDFPESDIARWAELTSLSFRQHAFDGGHFFINTHRDELLRWVVQHVAEYRPPLAGAAQELPELHFV
ncbi:thioesterase II family protein [Tahibacter amnicola]|uniref:Thioesterase domain-containing protein n=1 Tax=Tahibacter amnicola TaxID=2976241 RepID=A0ABY6B9P5_9GAMM|nr:thioesterase domain-containing protein [Tahibacter amnicola]UXI66277.1 thioesterase domain-containing protein [Tahibacter amnicola]